MVQGGLQGMASTVRWAVSATATRIRSTGGAMSQREGSQSRPAMSGDARCFVCNMPDAPCTCERCQRSFCAQHYDWVMKRCRQCEDDRARDHEATLRERQE
eukprot:6831873-Pyramimonas_sp.AAC.1